MIPYLLAIAGGYLIGSSTKDKQLFANGGGIENGEKETCFNCNGSGEGMYDGSICSVCGGLGVSSTTNDEYDGDYDEDDILDDVPEFYDGFAKGGEIDMDEIEKSALFYTDETKWTQKPTVEKFEKEIKEYEEVKRQLDNKEIRPSKIIGTGFKPQYARKIAYEWLNKRILIKKRAIEILKERQSKYAQGGEIAQTILQQLGGAGRLNAMTGAYNFIDRGNGLSFKIKNARANYIKITLNAKDLYDVEVGRIRGNTYKVVKEANDLYFDQLKPFIEESTGMYLSLFGDGGEVKIKAKKVELKTLDGKDFYEGINIQDADAALYHIWKRKKYSDVAYEIEFENGTELEGSIDLEPHDFHADHKHHILSWHIKNLWKNISESNYSFISQEDKDFGKDLIENYDLEYKKGGKIKKRTKFVDKVNAIADRLEGTKVPKRLENDYGKRYNRDEAEEAGSRIAGSQLQKIKKQTK
jgi:hypothetical protein